MNLNGKKIRSLFCLVHGSTQSASGWDLLVPKLQQLGHDAVRMNLPVDEPDASATRYADAIFDAIPRGRDDTIVVAHSASGLFLTLVPERRKVRRLVFLNAVIPRIGKSLRDQVSEDQSMFNPEWLGKDPTKDEQFAAAIPLPRLVSGDRDLGAKRRRAVKMTLRACPDRRDTSTALDRDRKRTS